MNLVWIILMLLGGLIALVGGILFLVAAFRESILWGLAVLFIPFAGLVFLIAHWQDAKKPFLLQLLGSLIYSVAFFMMLPKDALKAGPMDPGRFLALVKSSAGAPAKAKPAPARVEQPTPKPAMTPVTATVTNAPASTNAPAPTATPAGVIGMKLSDLRARLGPPQGVMRSGSGTVYLYPDRELFSKDGERVTSEKMR